MNADEHKKPFGEVVKETRTRLGLTQEEFGKILGVSHACISKIENGEAASITIKKLFKSRFGTNLDDLDVNAEDKPFGEIMRETRKRLGLTQLELEANQSRQCARATHEEYRHHAAQGLE